MKASELEESFEGPVTRIDQENYLVLVRNEETGEVWGMPECFIQAI